MITVSTLLMNGTIYHSATNRRRWGGRMGGGCMGGQRANCELTLKVPFLALILLFLKLNVLFLA